MKKVRSPKDIRLKVGKSSGKNYSPFLGRLNHPIPNALKKLVDSGKVSGNVFGDYNLDLMKLK